MAWQHEAIAADLRRRIQAGEYRPGDVLPGINALVEQYGAASATVRQALRTLQAEGLVDIRHGAGTFVRSFAPIIRAGQRRLSREVWGTGRSPWDVDAADRTAEVRDVVVARVPVPAEFAGALDLPYEAEVVARSRAYVVEDRPVMVATSYLPAGLAGGTAIEDADPGPGGIYARLAELGRGPARFVEELRARPPRGDEAARLRLPTGTYVLHIVRTAYDAAGRPVELADMVADPSVYVLTYEFDA